MWWPFANRVQHTLPRDLEEDLTRLPVDFRNDSCSNSPDSWLGWSLDPACDRHDWAYCSRCHPPGSMTYPAKVAADAKLREHIRALLPFRWRWAGWVYEGAVRVMAHASWDACGPAAGERCRHNITQPEWMLV